MSKKTRYCCINVPCNLAAATLDRDVAIIRNHSEGDKADDSLPSTLPKFLPHRDRGSTKKSSKRTSNNGGDTIGNRQLTCCVAEILIWSKTTTAMSNKVFEASYEGLLRATQDGNNTAIKSKLHTLQTIIRHIRKEINSYSREQGFMLSDQFALDPSILTMRQLKRGTAGDCSNLKRLASKKADTRVLKLLNLRYKSNPAKATRYGSVQELISSHEPNPTSTPDCDTEIAALERDILSH